MQKTPALGNVIDRFKAADLHIGKYRGQRCDAIAASDADYLRWIIEKSELEEGIKHSARYWLAWAPAHPPAES